MGGGGASYIIIIMKKSKESSSERRRYIRIDTVFPIEFQIYSKVSNQSISGFKQGFTRNVSEGGMCLEANDLENDFTNEIQKIGRCLKLFINMPICKEPVTASAEVRWTKKVKDGFPNRYLFGIEYTDINDNARKKIIGYAKKLKRRPRFIAAGIFILIVACGILFTQLHTMSVKKGITEKRLLSLGDALTKAHEERIALENKISALNMKRQKIERFVNETKNKTDSLEKRLAKMTAVGTELSDELLSQKITIERELTRWRMERESLKKQLDDVTVSRESFAGELKRLRDLSATTIMRVRLTNGNSIIGKLEDLTGDRLYIKIGLGSIGIERSMIAGIKELSDTEKIDIQKEWQKQEESARTEAENYKKFIEKQKQKGFVYFNGDWLKKESAEKMQKELKQKEDDIFRLIAKQRAESVSSVPRTGLLESLLRREGKPIISIKDRRLYLNGRLFFIKGVAYGIEYPGTSGSQDTFKNISFSIFEKDFQMMKKAGVNTIRTYEPLPEKLLDLAEKYDIMVIENVCYPSDNTDFNSRIHLDILKEQVRKYVLRDKDRRCILMWSIWNDAPWPWGAGGNVVKRCGFGRVNKFLNELYDTVKQYDISHPVTGGNTIGLEGEKLGWDFLDIIGLNLYLGGYDWFIEKDAERNIAEIKAIEDEYNKPVVILETGFSTFVKGQDQAEVLEKQIKIAGTNTSGITIFQWADGWQKAGCKDALDEHIEEHWGILDGYRNPKPGYKTVSRLFNEIPTESCGYIKSNDK